MTVPEKHGTAIEWTHGTGFRGETWNPTTGCDRVSPGCARCYALELAPKLRRFAEANARKHPDRKPGKWLAVADGGKASGPAFGLTLHPDVLAAPVRWRKPRMIFVNSMSDLFHEEVPDAFIAQVFAVMAGCPQHIFQVLTKRPDRMVALLNDERFWLTVRVVAARGIGDRKFGVPHATLQSPLPNVWLGVTIENRKWVGRADLLRGTPAAVRFISAEPLLGPLVHHVVAFNAQLDRRGWGDGYEGPELDLTDIHWLIVGGESGSGFRPLNMQWVRDLHAACLATQGACEFCDHGLAGGAPCTAAGCREGRTGGTSFFFKQMGGRAAGSTLGELPVGLQMREMPACSA